MNCLTACLSCAIEILSFIEGGARILSSHALTLTVEFRSSTGRLVCVPNVNLFSFDLLIGEEDALSHLTECQSAFEEADGIGWIPLHKAAMQLNKNILEITLKASKPSVWEQTTHNGETPLFLAVSNCLLENASFLLLNGCNPNAKNFEGNSPLLTAVLQDSYDMAALLISHGADVNLQCANKRTALHEAAKLGRQNMVKLMLASGAHPDPQSSYGFTPLALAAQSGHTEIMKILLRKGKVFYTANTLPRGSCDPSVLLCKESFKIMEANILLMPSINI